MKRILIFSLNYYPRFIGGAEIAIKEITGRISPEQIEFHMVTLRFDSNLPKIEQIGNVLVHRIGFARKNPTIADLKRFPLHLNKYLYQYLATQKASSLHRLYHYDALWAMMAHSTGIPAAHFKSFHTNVPYILTLQEGDPSEYVEQMMRPVWRLFRRAFTIADRVQAISSYLLAWARRMGFVGHGEVIPNGVTIEKFVQKLNAKDLKHVQERLGKKPGDLFLVTTSRLVHKNGIDTVIAALAHLPAHVHFLIFGIGPLENALKAKAAALKLEERVHFAGEIPHEELPYVLAACDIFVRPSRSEGMGNSFIEAMAAGLPVIATQEGGIADFIFDEKRNPDKEPTGWAVNPDAPVEIAAAVKNILGNPEKAAHTAENAYRLVREQYDWDSIAIRMKEVFDTARVQEKDATDAHNARERLISQQVARVRSSTAGGAKPLNLLIATPLYPPNPGGPATYAKILEENLPSEGIQTIVVKFSDARSYPKALRHTAYFWSVLRAGRKADVILALDPVSTGLPASLAALLLRKPFAVKIVGDYAWEQGRQRFGITVPLDEFVSIKRTPLPVAALRAVQSWVARRARIIMVPSEYLKEIVLVWGISEKKIRIIHNAIELLDGGSVPDDVRTLPRPHVVTVARLVAWKGMRQLIDAVARVRASGRALSLTIVGDGPLRAELESHAQTELKTGYAFTGALPPEGVHAILKSADIFALNSSYEGLSHVLIEALKAGLPIVTTRVGGNAEVISEETGLLIGPGDTAALAEALRALAVNPELRAHFSRAAKERAKAFSTDLMLMRTKEVLSTVA